MPAPPVEAVAATLGDIFNAADRLVVERVPTGVSTYVFRVQHGDEWFYLRMLPDTGATCASEIQAHTLALAAGARVPAVVHYEPYNEALGTSLMLTAAIAGQPLHPGLSHAFVHEALRAAGRDIALINAIPVDGFGWVRRDMWTIPERISAEQETLRGFMLADLDTQLAVLPWVGFTSADVARLSAIMRAHEGWLDDDLAYLAHGDFDASHIYADAGGYTGLIDFGEIRGAPRLYDLAHHHMHDGERLPYATTPWLIEGYRQVTPLPDDYEQRIRYFSLLIALHTLARGIARAPESQIVRTAVTALRRDIGELGLLA